MGMADTIEPAGASLNALQKRCASGPVHAIGLMSGTSMDGVDAALIVTDGDGVVQRRGPANTYTYDARTRDLLRAAMATASHMVDGHQDDIAAVRLARPPALAEAEAALTAAHADAVQSFLEANAIAPEDVCVVGFHGQTVLHRPDLRLTVQLGDGPALAGAIGLPVAFDFRAADVAQGGQGAPLVPVYHQALARAMPGLRLPVVFVNIGGVANVTYVGADGTLVACDAGPGNALIDDLIAARTGAAHDADGAIAASGTPDLSLVDAVLAEPFFAQAAPKSLDRHDFHATGGVRQIMGLNDLHDAAATLTELTAQSIACAQDVLPDDAATASWIIAGGGAHNARLMERLELALRARESDRAAGIKGTGAAGRRFLKASDLGWDGDALEAEAFAYLAVRAVRGLPLSYPKTTGVAVACRGGRLAQPGQETSIPLNAGQF